MRWACTSGVGGRGCGGEVVVEVSQLQCRSLGTQVVQHRSVVAVHGKLGGRRRGWPPHYELLPLPWRTQGGPICHPGPQVVVVGLLLLVGLDWVALYEACRWLLTSSLVKPSTFMSSLICFGVAT